MTMPEEIIVIDGGSIDNLFAQGGEEAWDQLLKGSDHVAVSNVILDELRAIPEGRPNYGLYAKFVKWMGTKPGISVVNFDPLKLVGTDPDTWPKNYGDDVLEALMAR